MNCESIRSMPSKLAKPPAQQMHSVSLRYGHPLAVGKSRQTGGRSAGMQAPRRWGAADAPVPLGRAVRDSRLARLEAVLLLANEPLPLRKISRFASLADATEARTLTRRLNQLYDSQGAAFRVEELAGGFQLLSRQRFGTWLRRLHQSTIETRLSSPALETLAIVAYRQPVLRAEIEVIRGVQCGEMLRQLMERDLVRIGGRSEELGRPFFYGTTRRFLQVFGLRHLDELPRAEDLRARNPQGVSTHESPESQSPDTAAALADSLAGNEPFSDLTFQKVSTEESEVTIAADPELTPLQELDDERTLAVLSPRASDDDFEEEEADDEDEDDDDDEDDDEEDDELDDDFDDDDWEEVDDEEGEDEEDEEDDDWEDDDEDDDDWEDDDDDEEEEWEEEKEEK
jgi:segregation and condensation protein B